LATILAAAAAASDVSTSGADGLEDPVLGPFRATVFLADGADALAVGFGVFAVGFAALAGCASAGSCFFDFAIMVQSPAAILFLVIRTATCRGV
jgi:hypothetical protein